MPVVKTPLSLFLTLSLLKLGVSFLWSREGGSFHTRASPVSSSFLSAGQFTHFTISFWVPDETYSLLPVFRSHLGDALWFYLPDWQP